jgi:hypothetical protein
MSGEDDDDNEEEEEEDWWLQDQVATSSHLVKMFLVFKIISSFQNYTSFSKLYFVTKLYFIFKKKKKRLFQFCIEIVHNLQIVPINHCNQKLGFSELYTGKGENYFMKYTVSGRRKQVFST